MNALIGWIGIFNFWAYSSDVFVVVRQFSTRRLRHLLFVLGRQSRVHLHLGRSKRWHGHELQVGVADQFACQIQERLLEVVVAFGRNVVVLINDEGKSDSKSYLFNKSKIF